MYRRFLEAGSSDLFISVSAHIRQRASFTDKLKLMSDPISSDLIETSMTVDRAWDGGVDLLRQFHASIRYHHESGPEDIGSVSGWIGWQIQDDDVFDAADAICTDASSLGVAAAAIINAHPLSFIENVLMIDRMNLAQKWRGNRLSNVIIHDLLALLRFDPDSTVVVLQPEPQQPNGGPYKSDSERASAMSKLQSAYRAAGLDPWQGTDVWWLEFDRND